MPEFNLRWANRSQSSQDWLISNGDSFTLQPGWVRNARVVININFTYQIVVSTDGGYAHVDLSYTVATNQWSISSNTPNEWQLEQGNGIVTLRCFLEDVHHLEKPEYWVEISESDSYLKGAYPGYQLYEDNTDTTYCSKVKFKSHAEGNAWIKLCLKAHPGTSVEGKPWTSQHQDGTVWP